MNTSLLRRASTDGLGVRSWLVPGESRPITMIPAGHNCWGVLALSWPYTTKAGHTDIRRARLDWHRDLVKREVAPLFQRLLAA